MLLAPRILRWREDFARLQPINLRILRVVLAAIVLTVFGLGCIVSIQARALVEAPAVGQALLAFLAVFWGYRAWVQWFAYRAVWPRSPAGRFSYYALGALFLLQSVGYALAAYWV